METRVDLVVRKLVEVPLAQEEAFRLFTAGMGSWWPVETHSIGETADLTVEFEGWVGGRMVERSRHGSENSWGEITAWDPPNGFSSTWHPVENWQPGDPLTKLSVRFVPTGDGGTRVELEHSGWEIFGVGAAERVRGYTGGWDIVLGRFVSRAQRR